MSSISIECRKFVRFSSVGYDTTSLSACQLSSRMFNGPILTVQTPRTCSILFVCKIFSFFSVGRRHDDAIRNNKQPIKFNLCIHFAFQSRIPFHLSSIHLPTKSSIRLTELCHTYLTIYLRNLSNGVIFSTESVPIMSNHQVVHKLYTFAY